MAGDMYVAADNIAILGGWAQDAIDGVADIMPGSGPNAWFMADNIAADLAAEAKVAETRAVEFLENQAAGSTPADLIDLNYWNPLPHGWGLAGRYSLFGIGDMISKADRGTQVQRWVNPRRRQPQHVQPRGPGTHRYQPGPRHLWVRGQHRYDRLERLSRDRPPQHRAGGRHRLWEQRTVTVGRFDRVPERPFRGTRLAGKLLGYGATAWLAVDKYNEQSEWEEVNDPDISDGDRRARAAGAATLTAGGAFAGAAAGAFIGSLIFPGVGTVVGALIGLGFAMVGAYIGATIGDAFSQWGANAGQAVWDAAQWVGNGGGDAVQWTGNAYVAANQWTANAVGDAAKWAGNTLNDAGEALDNAADTVGDVASGAVDAVTGWW